MSQLPLAVIEVVMERSIWTRIGECEHRAVAEAGKMQRVEVTIPANLVEIPAHPQRKPPAWERPNCVDL